MIYIATILTVATERATRAVHLAVLIGFAVVAPKFDPSNQDKQTMRTMCKGILCLVIVDVLLTDWCSNHLGRLAVHFGNRIPERSLACAKVQESSTANGPTGWLQFCLFFCLPGGHLSIPRLQQSGLRCVVHRVYRRTRLHYLLCRLVRCTDFHPNASYETPYSTHSHHHR